MKEALALGGLLLVGAYYAGLSGGRGFGQGGGSSRGPGRD